MQARVGCTDGCVGEYAIGTVATEVDVESVLVLPFHGDTCAQVGEAVVVWWCGGVVASPHGPRARHYARAIVRVCFMFAAAQLGWCCRRDALQAQPVF